MIYGGDGEDIIYGSDNYDTLLTNTFVPFSFPNDGDYDVACGLGEDDTLYGDEGTGDGGCLDAGDDPGDRETAWGGETIADNCGCSGTPPTFW